MFARVPNFRLAGWGRAGVLVALFAVVALASCTESEDTEPYVPAAPGAMQPEGEGSLLSEEDACERLRAAAEDASDRLRCDGPELADCPSFLRPGGGSGCYEYREGSIETCEQAYEEADSCRSLVPCVATAELNLELETCEEVGSGSGGAGGAGAGGTGAAGAPAGGEGTSPQAGSDAGGAGGLSAQGGQGGAAG